MGYICYVPFHEEYADRWSEVEKLGFGIEILDFALEGGLDKKYDKNIAVWKERLGEFGAGEVPDVIIHGPRRKMYPLSSNYAASAAAYEKLFDACLALGARRAVIHAGLTRPKSNETVSRIKFDAVVEFYRELAAMAGARKVALLIENLYEADPLQIVELIERVGAHNLKACLDTGHANCSGTATPSMWLNALGRHLTHVHIHNNDGKEDSHRSLDDGTIDFEDFFRALAELRLKPEICIEQTPEPLARSIDWLRERDLID